MSTLNAVSVALNFWPFLPPKPKAVALEITATACSSVIIESGRNSSANMCVMSPMKIKDRNGSLLFILLANDRYEDNRALGCPERSELAALSRLPITACCESSVMLV